MEVVITRQFAKDVLKELDKPAQTKLADVISKLQEAQNIQDITDVKKLKGYKTAFRIRLDNYRIGFILQEQKIVMSWVMHRKEIYRYFP